MKKEFFCIMKVLFTVFLFSVILSSCSPGIKEKHPAEPDAGQEDAQGMPATEFHSRLKANADAMDAEAVDIRGIVVSSDANGVRLKAYGKMIIHNDGTRSWMITNGQYEGNGITAFFSGYSLAKGGSFLLASGKTGLDDGTRTIIKEAISEHVAGMGDEGTNTGYLLKSLGNDGCSSIAVITLFPDYPYVNLSHVHYIVDGGAVYSMNSDEDYSWTGRRTASYSFFISSVNGILKKIEKASGSGYEEIGTELLDFEGYREYRSAGMNRLKELFTSNFGHVAIMEKATLTHHHKDLGADEYGVFTSLANPEDHDISIDAYVLDGQGCFYMVNVKKKDSGYAAYGAAGYEIGGRKHIESYNDDGVFKKENLGLEAFRSNNILENGRSSEAAYRSQDGSLIVCWDGNLFLSSRTSGGEKGFLYLDGFMHSYAMDGEHLMQDIPAEAKPVLMDMLNI